MTIGVPGVRARARAQRPPLPSRLPAPGAALRDPDRRGHRRRRPTRATASIRAVDSSAGVDGGRTTSAIAVLIISLWTLLVLARPLAGWKLALVATMAGAVALVVAVPGLAHLFLLEPTVLRLSIAGDVRRRRSSAGGNRLPHRRVRGESAPPLGFSHDNATGPGRHDRRRVSKRWSLGRARSRRHRGRRPQPEAKVRLPLAMMNRHGLVAGATGTGKTKTLQLIAEQLSAAGVPVLLADVKGDLSGIAAPGATSDRTTKRATEVGATDWAAGRGTGRVPDARQRRQGRAAALDDDQLRAGAAEQGARAQRRAVVLPRPGLPLGGQGRACRCST